MSLLNVFGQYDPIMLPSPSTGATEGRGSKYVFSGDYGGGTPTDTPTVNEAIGIDISNGAQWQWFSGAWH